MSAEAMYLEAVIKYSVFLSTLRTCFLVVLLVATFEGGCYNVIMWCPARGHCQQCWALPATSGGEYSARSGVSRERKTDDLTRKWRKNVNICQLKFLTIPKFPN